MKPKEQATRIWSAIVRSKGHCLACRSQVGLEAAHIITRSYSVTRTDLDNGICLCAKCHHDFTARPESWRDFIEHVRPGLYDELMATANASQFLKVDWPAEVERLLSEAVRLRIVDHDRADQWNLVQPWRKLEREALDAATE